MRKSDKGEQNMIVIEKDITFPFDVDKTLVFWKPEGQEESEFDIKVDYYGEMVSVIPHMEHVQLLRATIARGRNALVWSGNGYKWAKNVIEALEKAGHLPTTKGIVIMTKPAGYVDDMDASTWIGNRTYIKPHSNPYAEEEE